MFRFASFEVAQCSKFCSYSALEHITANRTNVTVLQLDRGNYKYGRTYVTRLGAGGSGVQLPARESSFTLPKFLGRLWSAISPLTVLLFAGGATGASR